MRFTKRILAEAGLRTRMTSHCETELRRNQEYRFASTGRIATKWETQPTHANRWIFYGKFRGNYTEFPGNASA